MSYILTVVLWTDHVRGYQVLDGVFKMLIPKHSLQHAPRLKPLKHAHLGYTVDSKFLPVAVGFQGLGLSHGQACFQEMGKGDLRPSGTKGYLACMQRPEGKK